MKRSLKMICVLLILLLMVSLVACGSEDNKEKPKSIVGKWNVQGTSAEENYYTVEFCVNGDYKHLREKVGTWKIEGDMLIVTEEGEEHKYALSWDGDLLILSGIKFYRTPEQ